MIQWPFWPSPPAVEDEKTYPAAVRACVRAMPYIVRGSRGPPPRFYAVVSPSWLGIMAKARVPCSEHGHSFWSVGVVVGEYVELSTNRVMLTLRDEGAYPGLRFDAPEQYVSPLEGDPAMLFGHRD